MSRALCWTTFTKDFQILVAFLSINSVDLTNHVTGRHSECTFLWRFHDRRACLPRLTESLLYESTRMERSYSNFLSNEHAQELPQLKAFPILFQFNLSGLMSWTLLSPDLLLTSLTNVQSKILVTIVSYNIIRGRKMGIAITFPKRTSNVWP